MFYGVIGCFNFVPGCLIVLLDVSIFSPECLIVFQSFQCSVVTVGAVDAECRQQFEDLPLDLSVVCVQS
jgi:hypothetical protein